MRIFKNILVIVNPHKDVPSALRLATELAALQGARLTLLDIIGDKSPEPCHDARPLETAMCDSSLERKARIECLAEAAGDAGMADIKVLTGIPSIEIIKQVLRGNQDLLIKPAEMPVNRFTLPGSTDMHLLRKCPAPVWLVRPTHRKKVRRIMAAVDPDLKDLNTKLNPLILELATSLAAREQAELHAVSVWSLNREVELHTRARLIKPGLLIDDLQKTYKRWLKLLVDPYRQRGDEFHVHLVKGKVSDAIPAEARNRHIDVIVMGTVGRIGIPGFFIGNTAERILARVNCSVLAVKPEGFVSPVHV